MVRRILARVGAVIISIQNHAIGDEYLDAYAGCKVGNSAPLNRGHDNWVVSFIAEGLSIFVGSENPTDPPYNPSVDQLSPAGPGQIQI